MYKKNEFIPVNPTPDFPKLDHQILKFWKDNNIFQKTMSKKPGQKSYVFYDGPPGTNGKPHIGHIMQSALKDLWPRFKTMQGFHVLRKAGWDTHGLPVELTAEAELGISGKKDIEKYGIAKFINYCRDTVLRFRSDWVETITRLGRFVDFENDYLTMSNDFIQSDWWILNQAFKKNLLYKDFKIIPYCCRCGTGLSSHEVAQGYQDVKDLTITAKFEVVNEENTYILAWTTTPWTLLGNVALTVGEKITYIKVHDKTKNEFYILAKDTLEKNKKSISKDYSVIDEFAGKQLVGKKYKPLWDFSAPKNDERCHEVVADDFVTTEDGTGIVHMAFFGEDDFRIIRKNNLYRNQHIGEDGRTTNHCGPYSGRFFKEEGLDVDIVKDLAAKNLLFDKYRYDHSYPHCWRCKTPLMYYARSSWFLKTTAIKETMIAENNRINWFPEHIKVGRFGKWLENNIDWAVSRERFWGSPLNIWVNQEDIKEMICPTSISELKKLGAYFQSTGKPITDDIDLHIHVLDDVVFKNKSGSVFKREKGVLDCWYNAGAMPWGQLGYPAKEGSEETFKDQFPADFICEAIDQTRGWFYTLLAVSTIVTEKSSFKNVICTELILDAGGKKMSKSIGNVIHPIPLIEKFGADAVRWTFYNNDPWNVQRYSEEVPKETLKAIFIPIWNCYSFFVTYALLDKWTPDKKLNESTSELDRWILSALSNLVETVTASLENYDVSSAAANITEFNDKLSNWYIRRSRRRFWKTEDDQDKNFAYSTLYEILTTLTKVLAPFSPFISETMYQNLIRSFDLSALESVHLASWPDAKLYKKEPLLEEEVNIIQEAASLARALRVNNNLKIRQPLSRLMLTPKNITLSARLQRHLDSLSEEVNVKEILIATDSADFIKKIVKPNWKTLGPKIGEKIKLAAPIISSFANKELSALENGKAITIEVAGSTYSVNIEDVIIEQISQPGTISLSGKNVTVALTTDLTQELVVEGDARELVSVIQRQRKDNNFKISDQIVANIQGGIKTKAALESFKSYITKECLIKKLTFDEQYITDTSINGTYDINGELVGIRLEVIG